MLFVLISFASAFLAASARLVVVQGLGQVHHAAGEFPEVDLAIVVLVQLLHGFLDIVSSYLLLREDTVMVKQNLGKQALGCFGIVSVSGVSHSYFRAFDFILQHVFQLLLAQFGFLRVIAGVLQEHRHNVLDGFFQASHGCN